MAEQGGDGGVFFGCERAGEGSGEGRGWWAAVGDAEVSAGAGDELRGSVGGAAREDEAVGVEFAGEEEAGGFVGGKTQALFFVENGVGEGCEAFERGDEAGGQICEWDFDLRATEGDEFASVEIAGDGGGDEAKGLFVGAELEVLGVVVAGRCARGVSSGERGCGGGGLGAGDFKGFASQAREGGEVGPLIGEGGEGFVHEDAIAVVAGGFLEGECD